MKSFEFPLEEPVEFSMGGDLVEGNSITFYAPKPNQRKKTTKIKQMFFRALPKDQGVDISTTPDKDEEFDIKGPEVLFLIAQSDADYPQFVETGRTLICDQVGKVDDSVFFTTVIADKLEIEVLEQMIGAYVANFIVKSSLKSLTKTL